MSPEFFDAIDRYEAISNHVGDDHPEACRALAEVMRLAPPEIQAQLTAKAREMGLMPDADGYTENGEALFTLETVAKHFGVSEDEVIATVGTITTIDPNLIHRRQ